MATLKISDLSVGDWVMVNEKPRKISVLANVWNGSNEVLVGYVAHVYTDGYNVVFYKPIEKVKPIPITAEILKKNGLEYDDDGNDAVIFLCCDMFWARLCVGDTFWQVGIHSEDRLDAVLCNVKHIHDLQHALRLAGIDKEINL